MNHLPFEEAREFVRKLGLKSSQEWKLYCISGKKPYDLPSNPNKTYSEWNGIGDWLGTDSIATFNKKFRPFKEARRFVQSLGLRNYDGWKQYRKSKEKPYDIPSNPRDTYGRQFKGYGDWLEAITVIGADRFPIKGEPFCTKVRKASVIVHAATFLCNSCKIKFQLIGIPANKSPNYCPYCGKKFIERVNLIFG